jgi:carboxylate-amine ligase
VTQRHVPLRQDILDVLGKLAPHAEALGTAGALSKLLERVAAKANGSSWLRAQLVERGSLPDVVRAQAEAWAGNQVL